MRGVTYELEGLIATISLEGEGKNLLTRENFAALSARLAEFDEEPEALVAVLRGAGLDHFSAGTSEERRTEEALDSFWNPHPTKDTPLTMNPRADLVHRPAKPVIAAITGACLDEALISVGQASDIRIAGEGTRFGFPGVRRGLAAPATRSRLHEQMPHTAVMWLALTGLEIAAEEALRVGLVTEVVSDAEVVPRAREVAEKVANLSAMAVRAEKEALVVTRRLPQTDAMHYAEGVDMMSHMQPDAMEGFRAWVERREPRFWRFEPEEDS